MNTALLTHVGRVRQMNEDRAWSGRLSEGLTAVIVADGMGGHRAGDVASGLAVDSLSESLKLWDAAWSEEEGTANVRLMIRKANEAVYETASLNEKYHNMGTTVVLAVLTEQAGWIGHIGDSRAYRLRDGELEQLTEDHTLVNELTKTGQISPEEAAHHPRRNVLTRALGTDRDVPADVRTIDWRPGDRLMLCSDGLSGLVAKPLLEETLKQADVPLDRLAEQLVEMALEAGGDDNITVVLVGDVKAPNAAEGGTA
ncbi:Stp1/IreP family PP2C-type Ser/Thr phosphatase [Cohnella faecalis]|uniref:Stp1/IreP family PP2C-type Ser/Thr phosphatase n=1 Tax=Cohnella faecalis TaxID=2315694 RepID=A0A398CPY5_9BACL|nr:Stp1/IreP family PP2C-type Ser/Thr phosphatase [Cohnella faecalis]RIE04502.1 Stp1/IreP family PP2C-type Ser/Thr phosphatase [Cohnella faecalis]